MIEAKNISKNFADSAALTDVSIKVKKGSIYGLVGSNGAGKTTLLKILAGVYRQDLGEVLIDNQKVFENIAIKSRTVFIPDSLYFFSQYTVQDMAKFYQRIYANWNEERYQKLKDAFRLDEHKKIQQMSKGMQRQAAFWLALSITPDFLLLDEPLDGLDPVMRQKVKNLIIQDTAAREMTVLISSHNLRELEDLCDCVGILHQGRSVVEKDLDALKSDIHKIQVAFQGDLPASIFGNKHVLYQEKRGSVLLFIIRGKKEEIIKDSYQYQPVLLDILPLTLEEIFIYEMGGIGYEIKNIIF
ncbi:ABC transporter ATP-binding protein YtrB [Sporotomaculum syntrophicum]|uniref:ABC transporter ATP-binding protein YtrB n=1 Tax=Sporotomaculum syntrophicum TaxID=182264 RepID=A0A9D2WP32_9FIRM|nr:ABC transporter ATP-binding protein [Sporotomaculum syntrophicum]KAF1085022.1 ABC transporter ATP-binding protein YtrB [Sporotomaculum syntrophicum]